MDLCISVGAGVSAFLSTNTNPPSPFGTGTYFYGGVGGCEGIASADFDADGHDDLILSSGGGEWACSILPGLGSGTFAQPRTLLLGPTNGAHVAAGDFDGDGFADFAIAFTGGGGIRTYRNNGDGTFQNTHFLNPGSTGQFRIVAADLNNDGRDDIAFSDGDRRIYVLLALPDGLFPTPSAHVVGIGMVDLKAADLNGDGLVDLVGLYTSNASFVAMKNRGNGQFIRESQVATWGSPNSMTIADIDGDSLLDIAVAAVNRFVIHRGNGNFAFDAPLAFNTGWWTTDIVAGDFDHDGRHDLAVASLDSEQIWIHLNSTMCNCIGDFNEDGGVDGSDVSSFFMAWESGNSLADVNMDGGVDGSDVDTFFLHWENGC